MRLQIIEVLFFCGAAVQKDWIWDAIVCENGAFEDVKTFVGFGQTLIIRAIQSVSSRKQYFNGWFNQINGEYQLLLPL